MTFLRFVDSRIFYARLGKDSETTSDRVQASAFVRGVRFPRRLGASESCVSRMITHLEKMFARLPARDLFYFIFHNTRIRKSQGRT